MLLIYIHKIFFSTDQVDFFYVKYLYRNVSMISYRFIQFARNFDTHKYKQHTRKKQSHLLSLSNYLDKKMSKFLYHISAKHCKLHYIIYRSPQNMINYRLALGAVEEEYPTLWVYCTSIRILLQRFLEW